MGFLSTLTGALKEGARQGIATGLTSGLASVSKYFSINDYNDFQDMSLSVNEDIYNNNKNAFNFKFGGMVGNVTNIVNSLNVISEDEADKNIAKVNSKVIEIKTPSYNVVDNTNTDILSFEIPDWTYADWINERTLWQKQITSIFDEPGYFYFKVFFKFNTQHGLFGGLLNNANFTNAINSAAKYLYISKSLYRQERPLERITALFKFASLLSYINTYAPWYFRGIKGLDACSKPIINNFSEQKSIELELSQDAIDMRLTTLMSLYKFACYDDINCKEIIPENLRKFDMMVVVFAAPIKNLHTSLQYNEKLKSININEEKSKIASTGNIKHAFAFKSLSPVNSGKSIDWSNVMSYKMYTFTNCEFDIETLGTYMPSGLNNSDPFKLAENSIKINYDRVYEHNMNEFYGLMFGSDGIYYNQYSSWQWNSMNKNDEINKESVSNQELRYSAMSDVDNIVSVSESLIHNRIRNSKNSSYELGNIYNENVKIASSYDSNGKPVLTDYYKMKLKHLKNRLSTLQAAGGNILLKMLNSSYSSNSSFGNLYGDVGIGSAYWKEKIKLLKNGNKKPNDVYTYRKNQQSYNSFNLNDYLFQTTRNKK